MLSTLKIVSAKKQVPTNRQKYAKIKTK